MRSIYLNGEFVPESEAKLSVFDRGVLFADSVYEVVAIVDGKIADFEWHFARLERSLNEIGIVLPFESDALLAIWRELVARNDLLHGTVYLQVTRGNPGDRRFKYGAESCSPTVFCFTQEASEATESMQMTGTRIITRPDLRWHRSDIKTTQLLYASMVKTEAQRMGVDDVWLVRDGVVTEGASQNAHIISREGVLVTHPLDQAILPGITRIGLLEAAAELALPVEERAFTVEEALAAAEAFTSSTSLLLMPVIEIDGQPIGAGKPGPITRNLQESYQIGLRNRLI
jgi:D-alanine transaminase